MTGTTLAHYNIVRKLGSGGMADVYLARDTVLERFVALKVLPSESSTMSDRMGRFIAEAKAASALNHPYIATVHELREAGGVHFIVMEYVEGDTLKAKVAKGPLKSAEIVKLATQIAEALDAAHVAGLVHRDIKSSNIMLTNVGHVKVLDFGLAKQTTAVDDNDSTRDVTEVGMVVGTPAYMSPEQTLGKRLDRRSDLFSLGVVLYEMATGSLPFSGSNRHETIDNIRHATPAPMMSINPSIRLSLERIILRCLEKDPAGRFQTASQLAIALREFDHDPSASSPDDAVKNNLPHQLTRFVGRQREIVEIREAFRQTRLLTLSGPGGIGKTRLAVEVAFDALRDYTDGVWFVDFASLADAGLVPQTVASVLGVVEEQGRSITDSLADYLKVKQVLLILDNCEHLIGSCARLSERLLRGSSRLRVLATSRESLAITGEAVFRVPSLGLPDLERARDLDSLTKQEAVELFVDRARSVKSTFAIDNAASALLVARLCVRLDGIPLAIELAASRMKALSVGQIAERLNDRFKLLTGGSRTALPRHQTLLAAIEWSYNLLADSEQTLFRRLSVFSGGWTLEAAEAVCGREDVESVLELLSGLVDKSLVLIEERDGQQRYRFMVALQEYAQRLVTDVGEAQAIARRHAEFFFALALEGESKLIGREQRTWLERLNAEHDNLRAVLNWAARNDLETGLRLAGTLSRFWELRGHWQEGRKWLAEMLEASETWEHPAPQLKALNGAAFIASRLGEFDSARSYAEQALIFAREAGDRREAAMALNTLAVVAGKQGDFVRTRSLLEKSLAIRLELGDQSSIAITLSNVGIVDFRQGEFASARRHFQESLAISREQGDRRGIALSLLNLGDISRRMGDNVVAVRSIIEEGLALAKDLSDRSMIPMALSSLGDLAGRERDYAAAHAFYSESLAVARELGDKDSIADALLSLGVIAEQRQDYPSARSLFDESLSIRRELSERPDIAEALNWLGTVTTQQGDYATARAFHDEALVLCQQSGAIDGVAQTLAGLADLARLQSDHALAVSLYKQSLAMRSQLGARPGLPRPLEHLATVLTTQGRHDSAVRLWGAAHALRTAMSMPRSASEMEEYDGHIAAARLALGEEDFTAAWEQGLSVGTDGSLSDAFLDFDV